MKILFFSLLLAAAFAGAACSKNEAPSPEFNCSKDARITMQLLGDVPVKIEYDERGRIIKVFRTDGKGLTENYTYENDTTLVITRNFSNGGIGNTFRVFLTSLGYVSRYETVGAASGYAIRYLYDGQGYLTETFSRFQNPSQTMHSVNIYRDGNLQETRFYTNDKLTYTETYTYLGDLNKANLISNQNQPDMYGRNSRNLAASLVRMYVNGKKERTEFKYDLNGFGFVKSLTETFTDAEGKTSVQVNVYDYLCL